ncbi:uncharacterized protein PITG_20830 [Phytophthora infestans T30-4]|uniref:Uncharacterized protein n=1 Tax=Phytophthora infestans (strain T30-4) TaxID=403677 RepID=D0P2K5_PHYIT|nr:uncharacterized protein PITG_20830 [Phytophthora infestans T30-4]EEY56301.1 conserved hypothetical protein [Phytophthora infestans T30-4]|eukprot:XP_002895466.1 conserved hypothetical protein [Phytophthora infestans T30-4]
MTKVPYGSATTKECVKCERSISRTSFSKHGKKCKGIKARESRVDIRKRSWVEHRAKRVSEQRSRRATQLFQKLEAEFEGIYMAGFIEKDKICENKMKGKEKDLTDERRFREVFGFDSDSEEGYITGLVRFFITTSAFMESVSASASVSSQTAEKIRAAVANYYEGYERRDAAGPDKWMVLTDDQAKDAFVRQFMRGLQKRKNSEFKQRQATPISLNMLRVLHSHLESAPGFTEASRLWVPYYIFSTQTVKKGKRAIEKLPPSKGPNLQIQCAVSSAYGVVAYRNKRGSIKMQDNADFVEELYKVVKKSKVYATEYTNKNIVVVFDSVLCVHARQRSRPKRRRRQLLLVLEEASKADHEDRDAHAHSRARRRVNMPKITQCMVPKMGLHAAKLVNAAIFFEDMVYGEWVDM